MSNSSAPTLGILGDGQLGMLTARAAQDAWINVSVFGSAGQKVSPAGQRMPYVHGSYTDRGAIEAFAKSVHMVTSEWENVPAQTLRWIQESGIAVMPGARVFEIAQDRLEEKQFARSHGVETAPFWPVRDFSDLEQVLASQTFPEKGYILKTCRGGYDGRWQVVIRTRQMAAEAWKELEGKGMLILEERVDFASEVSVIVARNARGEMAALRPCENIHENGILRLTVSPADPARIPPEVSEKSVQIAKHLTASMDVVGLLTTEMFVMRDGQILVNEFAPRPHNSGHGSIEGYDANQYTLLVRAILWETLTYDPAPRQTTLMVNLLGSEIDIARNATHLNVTHPLDSQTQSRRPGVRMYDYGKGSPVLWRKMGHFTVVPDITRRIDLWALKDSEGKFTPITVYRRAVGELIHPAHSSGSFQRSPDGGSGAENGFVAFSLTTWASHVISEENAHLLKTDVNTFCVYLSLKAKERLIYVRDVSEYFRIARAIIALGKTRIETEEDIAEVIAHAKI